MRLARFLGVVLVLAALTASAQGQTSVTLAWDRSAGTNIAGYKIYYGVASRTYSNTNNVSNVTNATISSLASGTIYYFAATAINTSGSESGYSTEVVYTNPVAIAPTIVLSSPVNGASYTAPATISCAASVTPNGHTITQMQFYNGATLLGTVAAAPYSYSWNSVSAGTYSLSAKAVYDSGSTVASTPANVTVTNVPLPSIVLTAPVNGASYTAPATISLAATVTANGHTITKVQFYSGATLLGAVAAVPYSYSWNSVSAGTYSLSAKVVYDTGSTASSAPVNVTCVNATSVATIWPTTAVPGMVDVGPDSALELGVKFRSDVAGSITGIRFYKATANTGTHLGHLWSSTGTLLASATFTGESTSGWQQVNFATPVAITANTIYVASYYATVGHYCYDLSYFSTKGVDNPPLHALTDGVSGGNGVYAYGASSTFPNQTWSGVNYWVDVVWQAQLAPTLTSIAVTPANPTISAGATQQFTAIGTYSDGSTMNVTSQATWTSSNTAVVTINATGLATAVSAGTTTLSAALNGLAGNSTPTVTVNPPTIALTSPLNGSNFTAPATINLAASISANGHSITKVQFYNGATLLGEDTSAPYNWSWTNVSAGSYSLSASLVYDTGSTLASSPVSITVMGLPAPWQTTDIGKVGVTGSASMSNGLYTVQGAGNISGTTDNFRFVYQPLSGDGEIKVRLNSVGNTGTSGRIGVMIRESLTSGSKYAWMGISPDGTFRWQRRSNTGGSTSTTTSTVGTPPNAWTRLVRTGNALYGYNSTNGTNWTQVNSRSITMATYIYVGLAVASGSSNTLNTATFTNVIVVP
jgi:sulfur relay (sulfurtransferase) complex TusBCD TusD component (DsrE family)